MTLSKRRKVGHHHRFAEGAEHVGAIEKVATVDPVPRAQVLQRHPHDDHRVPIHPGDFLKPVHRAVQHIEPDVGNGPEPAPRDEDGFLVEHLRRLHHFSLRGKHRGIGQSQLHQLQTRQAVVNILSKAGPENLIMSMSTRSRLSPSISVFISASGCC